MTIHNKNNIFDKKIRLDVVACRGKVDNKSQLKKVLDKISSMHND